MQTKYCLHNWRIKKVAEWTDEASLYCTEPSWGSGQEVVIFEDGSTDFATEVLPLTWQDLRFKLEYCRYVHLPRLWRNWGMWVGFITETNYDDLEF